MSIFHLPALQSGTGRTVPGVPAHGGGWDEMIFKGPSTSGHSVCPGFPWTPQNQVYCWLHPTPQRLSRAPPEVLALYSPSVLKVPDFGVFYTLCLPRLYTTFQEIRVHPSFPLPGCRTSPQAGRGCPGADPARPRSSKSRAAPLILKVLVWT